MLAIKFRFDISLRGGKVNLQDPKVEKEKKGWIENFQNWRESVQKEQNLEFREKMKGKLSQE